MYRVYKYEAVNCQGEIRKGMLFAASEVIAAKFLLRYKLVPIKLVARSRIWGMITLFFSRLIHRRSQQRFKLIFLRQLADFLLQNFSLTDALMSITQNTNRLDMKLQLHQVLQDTQSGYMLTSSLGQRMKLFTPAEINLLNGAEKNNTLGEALNGLHNYLSNTLEKENLLIWFIPASTLILSIAIISSYLANNVINLYLYGFWMLNLQVPFSAKLFLLIYEGNMVVNALVILLMLFAIYIIVKLILKHPRCRGVKEYLLYHLPIVKNSVRLKVLVEFTQAMSLGLEAKLPLHKVIGEAANALSLDIYKKQLVRIHGLMLVGYDFSNEISSSSLFKSEDVFLFKSALKTANITEGVEVLSEYAASRYRTLTKIRGQIIKQAIVAFIIMLILFTIATMLQLEMILQSG